VEHSIAVPEPPLGGLRLNMRVVTPLEVLPQALAQGCPRRSPAILGLELSPDPVANLVEAVPFRSFFVQTERPRLRTPAPGPVEVRVLVDCHRQSFLDPVLSRYPRSTIPAPIAAKSASPNPSGNAPLCRERSWTSPALRPPVNSATIDSIHGSIFVAASNGFSDSSTVPACTSRPSSTTCSVFTWRPAPKRKVARRSARSSSPAAWLAERHRGHVSAHSSAGPSVSSRI